MATEQKLSFEDAKQSLTCHAVEKGVQLREKHGPELTWSTLASILDDRSLVRYPCEIAFDASGLLPGEMAHPFPKGEQPENGFRLHIHPRYMTLLTDAVAIVLYQLVSVNYGEFACAEDGEAFGSAALGISPDEYYERLCLLADQLGGC